jgi:hypothetical protein
VLLAHLVMFGFVYPGERDAVPAWLLGELSGRLAEETQSPPEDERICRGTLVSRQQYLIDVEKWSYHDARLKPAGGMSAREIAHWTADIDEE